MSLLSFAIKQTKNFFNAGSGYRIETADLATPSTRAALSVQLQDLEAEFTYPLGESLFVIKHGHREDKDYFSFFEQFGTPHVFLVYHEASETLVGVGCAILRTLNGERVWYLGDFKIVKSHRGKGILKKIMAKHFLQMYMTANKMIAVNMSPPEGNGLIQNVKALFSYFDLRVEPLYFFEWKRQDIPAALRDKLFVTNAGVKDIIIEGKPYQLAHLCDVTHYQKHLKRCQASPVEHYPEDTVFMYCGTEAEISQFGLSSATASTVGTFVSYGVPSFPFSSVEI